MKAIVALVLLWIVFAGSEAYAEESCSKLGDTLAEADRSQPETKVLAEKTASVCRAESTYQRDDAFRAISAYYFTNRDFKQALAFADEAVKRRPNDLNHARKATILFMLERWDDAIAEAKPYVDSRDRDAKVGANLTVGGSIVQRSISAKTKDRSSAERYLVNAVLIDPINPQANFFLGVVARSKGEDERAQAYFKIACDNGLKEGCDERRPRD